MASNSHVRLALAINVDISFLKSVSSGTLYATVKELDGPKRLGAYAVLVSDEQGHTGASFNGMVHRKKQTLPLCNIRASLP